MITDRIGLHSVLLPLQSIREWTLNLNWSDKKVKTKNSLGCFEIKSMFRTSVHGLFLDLTRAYNMVRVIEGKIV